MSEIAISVVLPVYNEMGSIPEVIQELVSVLQASRRSFEIIVVEDGSEDETLQILQDLIEKYPNHLRVAKHLFNRGNGAAWRSGIRLAQGDIVVTMDADGQHSPKDILRLLDMIPPYDLVVGARTDSYQGSWYRNVANRFYSRFASWLSQSDVKDLTSGFRAMRRSVVKHFLPLFPSGFSAPTTTTLAFLKAGYNVAFIPIHVRQRQTGTSKISLWADGSRFIIIILRMIMLYDPLRIFFPTSIMLGVLGIVAGMLGIFQAGRLFLPNSAILLFLAALLTLLLGLLASLVSSTLIQYHGDETIVIHSNKQQED
jgi:glycosyltransferase involved in cell wall biosynthesis